MIIQNKRLNSKPLIVHAQGTSHKTDKWLNIIKSNHLIDKTTLSKDITILTFVNGDIDFSLINQLEYSGINYINVGEDIVNWKNTDKMKLIIESIEDIRTPYILCLDAVDVLCSYDLSYLLNRFESFDCDILYNASIINYPNICTDIEETESVFNTLNSGAFIGKTESIKNFYQYIIELDLKSDIPVFEYSEQLKVRKARETYSGIKVDTECIIFQTLNGSKYSFINDVLFIA